jgi:iron complex outermembrane receptor protein
MGKIILRFLKKSIWKFQDGSIRLPFGGGTYRTESLGSLDIALQKKFLKDKLNVRIAVSDVLFTSPWSGRTEFANVIINGRGGSDSRQLRFNLTYNFGNDQVKRAQNRNTGVEDEKNRIGN